MGMTGAYLEVVGKFEIDIDTDFEGGLGRDAIIACGVE